TAAAIVLAGCGLKVAKHGNRALSSKSGAADALAGLGVDLDAPFDRIERAIAEAGVGVLMAPRPHPAMRSVMPTRIALGVRTVFNILGPLTNPACVDRILIGVFDPAWLTPIAETLARLGTKRAWVVHGAGGLDEVSTLGPTQVAALADGVVTRFEITPADADLPLATLDGLKGGDAAANAAKIRALLRGETGPYRDIVVLNAAAALVAYGEAADLRAGAVRAAAALDDGAAAGALDRFAAITKGTA
ncbi:MAG: anthranilate phosphoribosyltransferase, partial [Pseudomonadota bacterium]